jgi:hypothetical protein
MKTPNQRFIKHKGNKHPNEPLHFEVYLRIKLNKAQLFTMRFIFRQSIKKILRLAQRLALILFIVHLL